MRRPPPPPQPPPPPPPPHLPNPFLPLPPPPPPPPPPPLSFPPLPSPLLPPSFPTPPLLSPLSGPEGVSHMFFSPSKRVLAPAVLVASALLFATPCSRGDDLWRAAKDYTASIYKVAADAAAALDAARSRLAAAASALTAA